MPVTRKKTTTKTTAAKPAPKPAGKSTAKSTAKGKRAQTVTQILERVEKKLAADAVKATLGDYIRLVQLQKELEEEAPSEIKVSWVEKPTPPKSGGEK